jgi:hypothetical protein
VLSKPLRCGAILENQRASCSMAHMGHWGRTAEDLGWAMSQENRFAMLYEMRRGKITRWTI